jgi:hypothetical protein
MVLLTRILALARGWNLRVFVHKTAFLGLKEGRKMVVTVTYKSTYVRLNMLILSELLDFSG